MEQGGSGLIQLLPLVMINLPMGIITIMLAKRKGRFGFLWKSVGFIPVIGWSPLVYLIGVTDKAIYDKLDEISGALEQRIQ